MRTVCWLKQILKSLLSRRTTFLNENEWSHIPWTLHPKTPFHQLLDLATEAAALLGDHDRYAVSRAAGACTDYEIRNLLIKTALSLTHLRRWHARFNTRLPDKSFRATETANDTILPTALMKRSANCHWYPGRQYPRTRFSFELIQQARLMLFYWAVVLTLQSEVFGSHSLRSKLHEAHELFDAADCHQEIEGDIRASISIDVATECADNIVKWFEFAAQDVWNSFGPAFGVFSLKAAITWYSIYRELPRSRSSLQADRSEELERAQSMLLKLVNCGSPPTHRLWLMLCTHSSTI